MMSTLGQVIDLISDYGWVSLIIFFAFYILVKLTSKKLTPIVKKFINYDGDDDMDSVPLKYHPFFYNIQYRLSVEIPNLEISPTTPVKQQLFRDLIYFRIRNIYDVCREISEIDMSEWDNSRWATEITYRMNMMMSNFNNNCKEAGIPDVVISKFTRWHSPTVGMLYEYIDSLGSSNLYHDNRVRTGTFFIIMNLLLITTIADAERTLKELNGDIAGKTYKNMIIEH